MKGWTGFTILIRWIKTVLIPSLYIVVPMTWPILYFIIDFLLINNNMMRLSYTLILSLQYYNDLTTYLYNLKYIYIGGTYF